MIVVFYSDKCFSAFAHSRIEQEKSDLLPMPLSSDSALLLKPESYKAKVSAKKHVLNSSKQQSTQDLVCMSSEEEQAYSAPILRQSKGLVKSSDDAADSFYTMLNTSVRSELIERKRGKGNRIATTLEKPPFSFDGDSFTNISTYEPEEMQDEMFSTQYGELGQYLS